MKKHRIIWLGLLSAALLTGTAATSSAQIVLQVTAGTASGSNGFPMQLAFDTQPLTPPTLGLAIATDSLGSNPNGYAGRTAYIDFGADFADITITEVWTAYRAWSDYNGSLSFSALWWSPSTDNVFDAGPDIAETGFNIATVSPGSAGEVRWTRDAANLNITPAAQYLILAGPVSDTFGGDRVTEIAFVGTVVPEPSSIFLAVLGAMPLLLGRRNSRRP